MNTIPEEKLQLVEMIDLFITCEISLYFCTDESVAIRRACKSMMKRFKTPKMKLYAKSVYNASNPVEDIQRKYKALEEEAKSNGINVEDYFFYGAELDGEFREHYETQPRPGNRLVAKLFRNRD